MGGGKENKKFQVVLYNCVSFNIPNIMDTGRGRRKEQIPLSEGFGANKKNNLKFYYYK